MGKAMLLAVRFDWKDVKDTKNFGELYERIGLKKLIKYSIKNPDETGGEIIKANVYATSYVMAKIASIFSHNMLNDYIKRIEKEHKDDMDKEADIQVILEYIGQREYALGFEAGMVGPELTDFNTPTLKALADEEDDVTESDPVIYIFQEGTDEHVKPHKDGAAEFLNKIKAVSETLKKTDEVVSILKKEKTDKAVNILKKEI